MYRSAVHSTAASTTATTTSSSSSATAAAAARASSQGTNDSYLAQACCLAFNSTYAVRSRDQDGEPAIESQTFVSK